ncbi:claudin-23 [Protobothrops mucrosquamatus]|uniref:claudin-23 n=1 Tax=Protobothrops mucrosquamatus TaxID=103944 RepID=UPI000775CD7E|nr:claudin-23 [Protobothrops mucrosquamatus]XP_015673820.1 claudin-23 [Protobothrops mucrosquamatus]
MRTPTPMIVGLVLGPCGLVLNLTSTLAPSWRDVTGFLDMSRDLIQHQGIWHICNELMSTHNNECNVQDTYGYFNQLPVQVARGLMPSSLAVTVVGLIVTSLGVRCWQNLPHHLLAGLGGLVLFVSGLLSLIAVSWYNYELYDLPSAPSTTLRVAYCLVLGYLGSCLEIIGGISLTFSFGQCCKELRLKKSTMNSRYATRSPQSLSNVGPISAPISSTAVHRPSQNPMPRSYSNSLDVLEGETTWRKGRSESKLPCDTDV